MKKVFETAVILFGTMGWWGFVYPELCLLESAQEADICEETAEEETETDGRGTFNLVVAVPSGMDGQEREVRIKSRFAEYICQIKEDKAAEKEVENEKQKRTCWGF